MKYRKKPIAVEAFQMTSDAMNRKVFWPGWLEAAYEADDEEPGSLRPIPDQELGNRTSYTIYTLEGPHIVILNAWIIQGAKGEIWAVRDDIFRETYEPVTED